jgi:RHS repeat-associated protein
MLPAAKERTPPDFPLAAPVSANVAENSHRGFATKFPTRIGASSDLSPIARLGCGHVYDKTASARLVYPNGLESQFTYDTLNRITAMNAAKASYSYTLSPTGNRTAAVESSGRTLNWSYDGIYRLTNEAISLDPHSVNGAVGYGLDPVGNRQSQTSSIPGIGTGAFTYDADDRLNTDTYDANGNTLTSGGKTFAYDFENRLKSMNNGAVTILYDADGNRVAKTVNGATTRYLVDTLNPTGYAQVVEEVTGTTASRTYTYGLQRISQSQQINSAWTPSFYGYDGGGTARLLTDSTGTVTDTYDYDAYGNTVNTTGSTPNAYLSHGECHDSDLNLYYLRARWYSPATGRLLSTDRAPGVVSNPATLHRYLYAHSDPVNRNDPTGRAAQPIAQPGGGAASEYATLVNIGASLLSLNLLIQTDRNINCIWMKTDDFLEIALLKLRLSLGLDIGPPDPNIMQAGVGGDRVPQYPNGRPGFPPDMFPGETRKCRQIKCLLTCYLELSGDTGSKPAGRHGPFKAFLGISPPPDQGGSCDDACRNAQDSAKGWAKEAFGNDVGIAHCNQKPGGTRECWQ